jgi:predicted SAM-dependent methyltransferase
MHVQYGCGPFSAPAGWESFDASLTLRWERIPILGRFWTKNAQRYPSNVRVGDIVKGLPLPDQSCQGVFASHVLEHLAFNEFHTALDNTRRLMKPGGTFRMIVPDLEWAAREYVSRLDAGDKQANNFFLDETHLGHRTRPTGLVGNAYEILNTSKHMWMWDSASLINALREHGFESIRRCAYGDSEDPLFAAVENPGRFENAVAVEARA